MTTAGPLTVDFCGEIHEVDERASFTFGRLADLSIDDNPYMHRVLGRFEARHGRWWVVNLGSTIVLEIFDRTSHSKASLTPGSDQALPGSNVVVRFAAGPTVYEVDVRSVPQEKQAEDDHGGLEMGLASQTIRASDLPMTESQLLLVLSLAESKLREP